MSKLLDLAKLSTGSKLSAQVDSVTKISPALRQSLTAYFANSLLNKGPEANAQIATSKAPTTSPVKANAITQLLQEKNLFAIKLRALGRTVLAITEYPLQENQKLSVVIRADGQLQMGSSAKDKVQTALTASKYAENSEANVESTKKKHRIAADAKNVVLNDALRRYLPMQNKLSETFAQLTKINREVSAGSISGESSTVLTHSDNTLKQLERRAFSQLDRLVRLAPSIETLSRPSQLRIQIENSGAFLESKMGTIASKQSNVMQADTRQNFHEAIPRSIPAKKEANKIPALNAVTAEKADIKAEILRLVTNVSTLVIPHLRLDTKPSTSNAVDALIRTLIAGPQGLTGPKSSQASAPVRSDQLRALVPVLLSALSRISGLQVRHLTQTASDGGSSSFGNLLELPVRIGEQFVPLELQIQQKSYQEATSEDEKRPADEDATQRKYWQVFLEFDLGELGSFASDLRVQDDNVKTQLWVEQRDLWQSTQKKLVELRQALEDAGIVIEELNCQHGRPPPKKIGLRQSLVDVRT